MGSAACSSLLAPSSSRHESSPSSFLSRFIFAIRRLVSTRLPRSPSWSCPLSVSRLPHIVSAPTHRNLVFQIENSASLISTLSFLYIDNLSNSATLMDSVSSLASKRFPILYNIVVQYDSTTAARESSRMPTTDSVSLERRVLGDSESLLNQLCPPMVMLSVSGVDDST